ncbi:MFS-type transporter SLC18B1 [Amphibalanus amphitrite]|uniref:MFS-type transporter SLC18B1 n=1 Tax=Amphibalanus amphitrite TaxID=1232801 RepID=A0A6A4VD16_AMPAM|nr:MFS-type transporter SLC18B1 [Amphibalanus amphitrite]
MGKSAIGGVVPPPRASILQSGPAPTVASDVAGEGSLQASDDSGSPPTEEPPLRPEPLVGSSSEKDPLLALRPPPPVAPAPASSEPTLEDESLQGAAPDSGWRIEYHLLPHSVPADSHYWPGEADDAALPVEALFEAVSEASQPSQQGSSESLPPQVKTLHPVRRYRRMVSYSRTGLTPLYGGPPERSSSIPVHLDQISQDPSASSRYTATQKKLLFGIGLGELLSGCSIAILIPFFPTDAQARGVSDTVIGFVFSCYALTHLVMTPVASRLIPRFGMSQVLYLGLLLSGLSTVGFGALDFLSNDTVFIALCFIVRIISAVGQALFVTSSLTVVASQFPEDMNTAVGLVETCNAVGVSLGPALGGVLYELGGYGLPFYVLGGFLLLCAALNFWLTPWVERDSSSQLDFCRMVRATLRSPEIWLCMYVLITISIDWSAMEPGIQPYATKTLGITVLQMGLYFLVASGAYALVSPFWGKLADLTVNTYIQTSLCLAGSAVSLLLLAPSPLLAPLLPSWWLLGLGMTLNEVFTAGAFIPLFGNMLTSAVASGLPDDVATQSFISGLWWAVFSVGNVAGPAFSGAVTEAFSFPITMTCISVNTLCCALLMLLQACRLRDACCASFRRKLTGSGEDPERQPLLAGRERRASV